MYVWHDILYIAYSIIIGRSNLNRMEYKAKFSCVCQEGLRGSGDVLPRIVDLSTREREEWSASGSGHLSLGKEHLVNQWI